jgi:transposase
MKGIRISERTFELIKSMLTQGYSAKKISQMLPEEISVTTNTIYKVEKAATYDEYCGKRPEPKVPDKIVQITPYSQTQDVVDAINRTNVLLESLFQLVKELRDSLM